MWAIAVGAATNAYFHNAFTTVVASQTVKDLSPPKLYEKTDNYTVDDGCLAGAAMGMAAFLPTLFMRRATVPWWTRLMGMTNIGACTGVVASHAYFHYTGERQKALQELNRQRRRRTLEFHHIFWDKMLMQQLDPLIQTYVRHNGLFRAHHIPAEVLEDPDKHGILSVPAADGSAAVDAPATKYPAYYVVLLDWGKYLENLDVEAMKADNEVDQRRKNALLKEARYVEHQISSKLYDFIHTTHASEEDKEMSIRELQLLSTIRNRLRLAAEEVDQNIFWRRYWLGKKPAMDASSPREAWLPAFPDPDGHDPTLSIAEVGKFEEQFKNEIAIFESRVRSPAQEDVDQREKWRKDLEDARTWRRATDRIAWEMEKKVHRKVDGQAEPVKTTRADEPAQVDDDAPEADDAPKVQKEPPSGLGREKP